MSLPVFAKSPSGSTRRRINPVLKLTLEFGPLLVLFFANARGEGLTEKIPAFTAFGDPIFLATCLFMTATAVSLTVSWGLTRTLPAMPLVTGIVIFTFGALTLWLHNDIFIKIKPTIVNALFAGILLGSLVFGKSPVSYIFDGAFRLNAAGWHKLTMRWGMFFIFLAIVNEIVWRNFSTDFWVAFKVWGIMPIAIAFAMSQTPMIMRHTISEGDEKKCSVFCA